MERTLTIRARDLRRVTMIGLLLLACAACSTKQFPTWKVVPLAAETQWETAPIIVVGDVRNTRAFGIQDVHNLPWPASDVRRIYWCQGDLIVRSVVRGERPSPRKKYLWGSGFSGCELSSYKEFSADKLPITRLWFIREEGNYIRPVDDMVLSYIFHGTWDDSSKVDPQIQFALLLMNPRANWQTPKQFAGAYFFSSVMGGCLLLPQPRCIEQIQNLARLGDPDLRRAACDLLSSQFQKKCAP